MSTDQYEAFRDAMAKLCLNDAALHYESEKSDALGFGFRVGFLGMLHMEIVRERLQREYDLTLIATAPTVEFEMVMRSGERVVVDRPSKFVVGQGIESIMEPVAIANIIVPETYLGGVIKLCVERRGIQQDMHFIGKSVSLSYAIPMNEIVMDFFDRLKSISRGYASLDYTFVRMQEADLVRLDIMIASEKVDALAVIVHRSKAEYIGRKVVEQLKTLIPRQMFAGRFRPLSAVRSLPERLSMHCAKRDSQVLWWGCFSCASCLKSRKQGKSA